VRRTCAAEGCENEVPPRNGRFGRNPIYCSPSCRKVPPANLPVAVEIAHEPTDDARPAGRIFSVKLSRGDKTVTVAEGLGRPSAEHLAGEIISILAPSRPRGGTIS
jgi:hypothetical protein